MSWSCGITSRGNHKPRTVSSGQPGMEQGGKVCAGHGGIFDYAAEPQSVGLRYDEPREARLDQEGEPRVFTAVSNTPMSRGLVVPAPFITEERGTNGRD